MYARISTDDERQELDNQLIPLRAYAQSFGYTIVKEYVDRASGGNSNRPAFQEMLSETKHYPRPFNVILVWSLDRFSRESMLNTLHYIKTLKQQGVALKSLHESWLDTSDKGTGELMVAILSWIAEQERLKISERVKAGLKRAKNVGKRGKDNKRRRRSGYFLMWEKRRKNKASLEKEDFLPLKEN